MQYDEYRIHISIHALREEGDVYSLSSYVRLPEISIHALREEGDTEVKKGVNIVFEFLSTPSARRATSTRFYASLTITISIHALREEGDQSSGPKIWASTKFLSTPSARRATRPR